MDTEPQTEQTFLIIMQNNKKCPRRVWPPCWPPALKRRVLINLKLTFVLLNVK